MRTLLIACGNPLRGDDGAASEVLRLLASTPDREMLAVQQLTPELAEEIARYDRVVFLDAAVDANLTIGPLSAPVPWLPLTHVSNPMEIVALSRTLFGFTGEALLCRIPARDFLPGGNLSPYTLQFAQQAADELENLP
jgi:hydrogenase maturation protease